MSEPTFRIFYGKYLDQLIHEIPVEHIIDVDPINLRIEPGKPAEPKIDQISFTLSNKDQSEVERYDDQWFEDQARTEAERAVVPVQLFFSIVSKFAGIGYTGVYKGKKYGKWREQVSVSVTSPLEMISGSKLQFLQNFRLTDCTLYQMVESGTPGFNIWPPAKDLNGDDVTFEYIGFTIEDSGWVSGGDPGYENMQIINHFFGGDSLSVDENLEFDDDSMFTKEINAFVQIKEITLLTQIRVTVLKSWDTGNYRNIIRLHLYEAKNGIYDTGEKFVFERGRFFRDEDGNPLELGGIYSITLWEPDRGYSEGIIVKESNMPFRDFIFGCPVIEQSGESLIQESSVDYDPLFSDIIYIGDFFNVLGLTLWILNRMLLNELYDDTSEKDLFKYNQASQKFRYAFWADVMLYGWIEQSPADVIVNVATQTNSYLYINEEGQIVYQDRLLHEAYLPAELPPDSFTVATEDVEPLGDYTSDSGYDTFEVEFSDRIEINNVETDEKNKTAVDKDGVRSKAALRSSDIRVENYRTADLGVPSMNDPVDQLLFRRSPADPAFGNSNFDLDDFLPTPIIQTQQIAKSMSYPMILWDIGLDLNKYPQIRIGRYFQMEFKSVSSVWFIREVTYRGDQRAAMNIQYIGELES